MSGMKFTPGRGRFALKKDALDGQTSSGIVFTPKENVKFISGIVAAMGEPEMLGNGTEIYCEVPIGTRVLVSKENGYEGFGSFMIFQQKDIVATLDKDTKVS